MFEIQFRKLCKDAVMPTEGSQDAAAYDLYATEDGSILSKGHLGVSVGLACAMPRKMYMRVYARSGLAFKYGIAVGAGVIDSDYRGEIKVLLMNHGSQTFSFKKGDRIAQAIFHEKVPTKLVEVEQLGETDRGEKGFGSTGV